MSTQGDASSGPLRGIKILDIGTMIAAPLAAENV
jgi:crotonobetainyl-CoA:carnitine CoA-transferase CaiB-like acyl-CoA transferase